MTSRARRQYQLPQRTQLSARALPPSGETSEPVKPYDAFAQSLSESWRACRHSASFVSPRCAAALAKAFVRRRVVISASNNRGNSPGRFVFEAKRCGCLSCADAGHTASSASAPAPRNVVQQMLCATKSEG